MPASRAVPRARLPRGLAAGAALAVLCACAWLGATVARAQSGGERIHGYDVAVVIEGNGALTVTETIEYDFGAAERHGILRDVPVRTRYDDEHDRVLPLTVLEVSATAGASADYRVEHAGGSVKRIRIGDPDRTVDGRHTYTIRYRLDGVLNGFADHDELYLNAIGPGWDVPIDRASVTVTAPGAVTRVACFAGPVFSRLACDDSGPPAGNVAQFAHGGLQAGEAFSVVVAFPTGLVPAPAPILEQRWSLRRAFALTPLTVGAAVVLALLLAGGITRLVWVAGRDRRYTGSPVDVAFGTPEGEEQPVGLFDGGPYPVEYESPDGIRPGQVGTLIDEHANPLDVTATIVDLAARGHLRIEEIPKRGLFGSTDWRLHRLETPGELVPYEQLLINHLFADGDEVELSALKRKFSEELQEVVEALYADVVARGWFRRSPSRTRALWLGIGLGVLAAGVALTVAAIALTGFAVVPLPVVGAGIALTILHRAMPRRTARGTAALSRVRGFRRFIEEAEKEPARFAERANLFSEYLPYAIVFGCTERWAKAFAGLAEPPPTRWYTSTNTFSVIAFASAIDGFSTTSAGMIASTPAGSGSSGFGGGGFSGGGMGGGGGGSW
ncbi:MAG: DUF2207 domain-containing protein [Dehalococcoidia bacterium]